MSDPRKVRTLGEAALNPDGKTYNGACAMSWLSEALSPGNGISPEEVQKIWDEAVARKKAQQQ
jgi:hypothetical protein